MKIRNVIIFSFIILSVGIFLIFSGLYFNYHNHIPLPARLAYTFAPWNSQPTEFAGKGTLITYMEENESLPFGPNVTHRQPFNSSILRETRPVIVYLPAEYDKSREEPFPVIFILHGYRQRPQSWIKTFLPVLEEATHSGAMLPSVVIIPGFSISGEMMDKRETWFDDRSGSWYINSNLGRFEDYFFEEIIPFVFENFNVRKDKDGIVLLGLSMGGFGAIYYSIREPELSNHIISFFPPADLRYSIQGNRFSDYDEKRYAPIENDNPLRPLMTFKKIFGITEKFFFYPVFDSDKQPGEVWKDDKPLWQRLKEVNPADILRNNSINLSGKNYYILAGEFDELNFDAHVHVIKPLLQAAGADVAPENNIVKGGHHAWSTVSPAMENIFSWLLGTPLFGERIVP